MTSLPSEDVLAHEIGHAVEAAPSRNAESARVKADKAVTPKQNALRTAVAAFTFPAVAGISNAVATELAYHAALIDVNKSLVDVRTELNNLPDEPSAAALTASIKTLSTLKVKVKANIGARDRAKAKLPSGSSAPQATVQTGQDSALAAIDVILKAMQDRLDSQKELEKTRAAEAEIKGKVPGSKARVETSRRLAELVAIVSIKKVDVKNNNAVHQYSKDHWPDEPGELYADLFQMSLTEPAALKLVDPDIAEYFTQPIEVKNAALKKKVDAWVAAHK